MCETNDAHKDSCKYGVELSKHFITLASAGIAFVAGLAVSGSHSASKSLFFWTMILFAVSIALGLAFIMNVVGYINKHNNYDVYTTSPRLVMTGQLLAFAVAVFLVGRVTLGCMEEKPTKPQSLPPNLTVTVGNNKVEQQIPTGMKVQVKANDSEGIDITVEPQQ